MVTLGVKTLLFGLNFPVSSSVEKTQPGIQFDECRKIQPEFRLMSTGAGTYSLNLMSNEVQLTH